MSGISSRSGREELLERLNLFSRTQNGPDKLGRISVGSGKLARSAMDDFLDADIGKNDYDWLLTPPGTPLFPPSDARDRKPAPKNNSSVRSVSTTRPSRLSAPQSENGHSTRPARSSSAGRPSISTNYSSNYLSSNNRTSLLNTSSSSVNSRPSGGGNRLASLSTPTPRPSPIPVVSRSRPSTPSKIRPPPSSPSDKPRVLSNSRPSTPTRTPTNLSSSLNSPLNRPTSRPSTPTRRTPVPAPTPTPRVPSNGSRPSSPKTRALVRPIDFPLDVPPNLRTKMPERPVSAGRSRPGPALTVRTNANPEASSNRRMSLPVASRGKLSENSPKSRVHSNGHEAASVDIQKPVGEANGARRPSKPATTSESTGFGRTISKKSIDMALRHMDIRQSMGSIRGASLFPQSIRPASSKGRRGSISGHAMNGEVFAENGSISISNSGGSDGTVPSNGGYIATKSSKSQFRLASELDLYGSTRYEAMLMKEDSKNMNWLHSVEDKADQGPVFDHRFEPLPEPFGLL